MKLVVVADTFVPLRTSGAVQLFDLARELARQGHSVTVLVPRTTDHEGSEATTLCEHLEGIRVCRFRVPRMKDVAYIRRTLAEWFMPYVMVMGLRRSPLAHEHWDGVIWYSPIIFLSPLVEYLQRRSACRSYLIIRDIFPEWALDMGLLRPGLIYRMLRGVANRQFRIASTIGIQTEGNRTYFQGDRARWGGKLEVLHNWLAARPVGHCCIDMQKTPLAGRFLLVYAGNMGVAQGMSTLMDLADALKDDSRLGFVFVGRGHDYAHLVADARRRGLHNVWFHDEIEPDEVPGLLKQCHVGLVALDHRHHSHNIPGKFLSYMHAGLPVLASVNPGNDLIQLVESHRVGVALSSYSIQDLRGAALQLMEAWGADGADRAKRCHALANSLFAPGVAAKQIVQALSGSVSPR